MEEYKYKNVEIIRLPIIAAFIKSLFQFAGQHTDCSQNVLFVINLRPTWDSMLIEKKNIILLIYHK